MKILCAWCGQTLGYKCDRCGSPLTDTGNFLRCDQCIVVTLTLPEDHTEATHTICEPCSRKTPRTPRDPGRSTIPAAQPITDTDARSIAALDGAGNRGEAQRHRYARRTKP